MHKWVETEIESALRDRTAEMKHTVHTIEQPPTIFLIGGIAEWIEVH